MATNGLNVNVNIYFPDDTTEEIIKILRDAPRMGAEKDEPEGSRYIQISETLALDLLKRIKIDLLKNG